MSGKRSKSVALWAKISPSLLAVYSLAASCNAVTSSSASYLFSYFINSDAIWFQRSNLSKFNSTQLNIFHRFIRFISLHKSSFELHQRIIIKRAFRSFLRFKCKSHSFKGRQPFRWKQTVSYQLIAIHFWVLLSELNLFLSLSQTFNSRWLTPTT